ncbi:MAG: class I SAM-dependent methyltransferase [Clostridia bacterium]|nr:class I SAM-dependent methyltransferase [Clostridia bacterium]
MECRVCGNKTKLVETFNNMAIEVSKLYNSSTFSEGVDISLFNCEICGHIQIPYINSERYYKDFCINVNHSPAMIKQIKLELKELSALCSNNENFIEIGCGEGSFLYHSKKYFKNSLGIEPSNEFYKECLKKGLNVINDYFTNDLDIGRNFDAFAVRQVFEHITNPYEFLCSINDVLNDNAVGLIEVPNAQGMLIKGRYFDLFSDHVNYFTPLSLGNLAQKANFEIISISECFNSNYLIMYVRKKIHLFSLAKRRKDDNVFLKKASFEYKTISAWGGGAKAQAIMTSLHECINLKYIFDSDVNKKGKYIINTLVPITEPNDKNVNENELIIIFAISYQDEIVNLLRNKYKFTGDILCLDDKPYILKF